MGNNGEELSKHEQLLLAVAQQLRQPLMLIARQAELSRLYPGGAQDALTTLETIGARADSALNLIDNYVLSLQAAARGQDLLREPVSVAAALHMAAEQLAPTARQYGIALEVNVHPRLEPVQTNRQSLEAVFVSLGYGLIEALATSGAAAQTPLRLSAHRCRYGVVAGLYCAEDELTVRAFQRSRQLHGHTRQPHTQLSAGAGAGIFVADSLLKTLAADLKVSRYHHQYGLATILQPINQLALI